MTLAVYDAEARAHALALRGAFHPGEEDEAGRGTVLLLGPDEPGFWAVFKASSEYGDGQANPLDRWSKRVVGALAAAWGGRAVFPYDGPPYAPFIRWAKASHRAFEAPVGLLVHDTAGLFISYRGAVILPERIALAEPPADPCQSCASKPCEDACPVGALAPGKAYDVPACRAYLQSPEGLDCRTGGCRVRRACPVSQSFGRSPEQSAFHMAAFVKD